jgi:hypothetical protein
MNSSFSFDSSKTSDLSRMSCYLLWSLTCVARGQVSRPQTGLLHEDVYTIPKGISLIVKSYTH